MRQLTFEETTQACGAGCEDLTMTIGLSGVSVSGSFSNWSQCLDVAANWLSDTASGYGAHFSTGIPYGEAHVG